MADQTTFKPYLNILKNCPLFLNVKGDELLPMLACLNGKIYHYEKNETIISKYTPVTRIGILLKGELICFRLDFYGNRSILDYITELDQFGASAACAGNSGIPTDVVANTDSTVLFVDANRVLSTCPNSCEFHNQVIANLLGIVARKNFQLNEKIEIIAKRNTRDKLMTYLLFQATKAGSEQFTIPFNRQELADFLEVERSGLSTEISKLKKEGYLESDKNFFKLLKPWS